MCIRDYCLKEKRKMNSVNVCQISSRVQEGMRSVCSFFVRLAVLFVFSFFPNFQKCGLA